MFANEDDRKEAERLVDLDDRGRHIEAVAVVLAARRMAQESADELAELDRVAIDEIQAKYFGTGGDGASSGTEHVS